MPKNRKDDDAPRRRRGEAAAAVAGGDEQGLAMRLLTQSPRDVIAAMFASAAVIAIVSNAMFMQAGHHPSPMFGRSVAASSSVSVVTLPRPRTAAEVRADTKALDSALLEPSATELKAAEPKAAEAKPAEPKHVEIRPAETKRADPHPRVRVADADPNDPLGNLVRTTAPSRAPAPAPAPVAAAAPAAAPGVPRPPAGIPNASRDPVGDMISSSRRIASVQRALTEYGYGQLKPTGTVGSDTQAAIQRFERARRLPVTGQMSERLVRELAVVTGRPID
ncbi:MAG: peptidoglycan-binding protein [Rhodopseudomonas palustris]|uniref:Peptidoglycan-binding protein n=1 Tax=Rhodopseudomonas palustris TaxID=1076 RepID=A0A933RZU7_RHOPL|nr:peptidoglycan-binding protein [Rhodopseudomonas palustris]